MRDATGASNPKIIHEALKKARQVTRVDFLSTSFQVMINGVDGKTITVNVTSSSLVSEINKHIERRTDLRPDEQRLLYGGKQLQSNRYLSDYDIKANSTIHLVLRLPGGAFHCS
jgi:hypothetical protein